MEFFTQLESYYSSISVNGHCTICGDMNARLRCKYASEMDIIGDYFFKGIQKDPELQANRNFLVQLCHSADLVLANTFHNQSMDKIVTYYEIGAKPMDAIQPNKFAQLNFILGGSDLLPKMRRMKSIRELTFVSHHFLLLSIMEEPFQLEKRASKRRAPRRILDYTALQQATIREQFVDCFKNHMFSCSIARNVDE